MTTPKVPQEPPETEIRDGAPSNGQIIHGEAGQRRRRCGGGRQGDYGGGGRGKQRHENRPQHRGDIPNSFKGDTAVMHSCVFQCHSKITDPK